jgi:hypothetical protein
MLDANTGEKREDMPLAAHPENFQLDPESGRVFVNEPGALAIAIIDRKSGAARAASNFPMAFDASGQRLFVAYRLPALITMFNTKTGETWRLDAGSALGGTRWHVSRGRVPCGHLRPNG